jgi:hypothetical protein
MDIKLIVITIIFTIINIANTSIIIKRTNATEPCENDCKTDRTWAIALLIVSLLTMIGAFMFGFKKSGIRLNNMKTML